MKLVLLALIAAACSNPSKLDNRNVAEDTVLYVEPKAKCDRGFTTDAIHSVRCDLGDGRKIYCTASAGGWTCSQLTGQPQPAAAPQPTPPAPPAPTPPPAPPSPKK